MQLLPCRQFPNRSFDRHNRQGDKADHISGLLASIEPVSKRETPPAATKFGTSLRHRLRSEGNEYDLIFKVSLRTALQQQYQILDCPDQRQFLLHDHQPGREPILWYTALSIVFRSWVTSACWFPAAH